MQFRFFEPTDYEMIASWWKAHEWQPIPLNFLPKIGIIVNEQAAGFIYSTDSKICLLEWIVVDPCAEKLARREALDFLFFQSEVIAKELGFQAIFSSVSHQGLLDRYKKHNFKVTDKEMTNVLKVI